MHGLMRAAAATGLLAAVLLAGVQMYAASRLPLPSYDGRVIWEFKARILFERGINAGELKNPDALVPHADYPALLPLSAVEMASHLGNWSPAYLASIGIMAFMACLYLLWRQAEGSPAGQIAVLAWAFLPSHHLVYESCIRSGTADLLVGAFILGSGCCAVIAHRTNNLLVIAAGAACIGLATATKYDGFMWAIAFIPVGFALSRNDPDWISRGLQITAACGITVVGVAAPWLRMTLNWNPGQTEPYFYRFVTGAGLFDLPRWFSHAGEMLVELLFRPDRSSLAIWLVLLAASAAWKRGVLDPLSRAMLLAGGVYTLAALGAYQVSPWPTGGQVTVSFYRLIIQMAPLLTLVAVRSIRHMETADAVTPRLPGSMAA